MMCCTGTRLMNARTDERQSSRCHDELLPLLFRRKGCSIAIQDGENFLGVNVTCCLT